MTRIDIEDVAAVIAMTLRKARMHDRYLRGFDALVAVARTQVAKREAIAAYLAPYGSVHADRLGAATSAADAALAPFLPQPERAKEGG